MENEGIEGGFNLDEVSLHARIIVVSYKLLMQTPTATAIRGELPAGDDAGALKHMKPCMLK